MSLTNPYAQYRTNSVETASPTRLVVMLYDGAIRFLNQALPEMRALHLENQSLYIGKAQAIIAHLRGTLDFEAAPAISNQLSALYVQIYDSLTLANVYDKPEKVEEAIAALRSLREAWLEVDKQCQAGKAALTGGSRELIAA